MKNLINTGYKPPSLLERNYFWICLFYICIKINYFRHVPVVHMIHTLYRVLGGKVSNWAES